MLNIKLTDEQVAILKPYFKAVSDGNKKGESHYIGAQIWPDGMVVRLFNAEAGAALSAALGGDPERIHLSASDRVAAE